MDAFAAVRIAAPYIFEGAVVTLELVVAVLLVSTPLAFVVALARNSRHAFIAVPTAAASWMLRGVPPLVVLFFVYFVAPRAGLDIEPFAAAVIGMSLYTVFYLAEAVRSGLAAVPAGQKIAIQALALGRWHGFVRIVLPQALPAMIPPFINYATEVVKDSALAASIAVPEMMGNASQLIMSTNKPFQILLFVGGLYVAIDAVLLVGQAAAERRWRTMGQH